jgi:long-subunit fatty acid transport protein
MELRVLRKTGLRKLVLIPLLFAGLSGELLGSGFTIPHQTARGLGLSNASTAGINDPSAVYYNPAALGEVKGIPPSDLRQLTIEASRVLQLNARS